MNNIQPRLKYEISKLLKEKGFPLHLKGTEFLKFAVIEWIKGTHKLDAIYAKAAKQYNTSACNIERCMYYCVKASGSDTKYTSSTAVAELAHEIEGKYV